MLVRLFGYRNTVESPNNGHIGSGTTVLCWEVVLISEVPIEMYFTPQMHDSMYCLPSDIILFHCNQGSRVWTGDSMCVPSLWTKSVHRQDEGINRFSESWWTRIAS